LTGVTLVDILPLLLAAGFYDEHDSGAAHYACMTKIRYANKAEAIKARDRNIGNRARSISRLYFYPCKSCGGFHLTKRFPYHLRAGDDQRGATLSDGGH
jgi:hypothetical protein